MKFAIVSSVAISLATLVVSQQCPDLPTSCVNDDQIAVCNNGVWTTEACPNNYYCMTMNPAMIHCMIKPANFVGNSPGPSTITRPTDASSHDAGDHSGMDMSGSNSHSTISSHNPDDHTHSNDDSHDHSDVNGTNSAATRTTPGSVVPASTSPSNSGASSKFSFLLQAAGVSAVLSYFSLF